MTKVDQLVRLLDAFLEATPDVESAAVVTQDGFPVVCALPESLEERRLAAVSASIAALGERALAELKKGPAGSIFVEGERGYAAVVTAGANGLLTVTAFHSARVGLVLYMMKKAAANIALVMDTEDVTVVRQTPASILDLTEERTHRG